MIVFEKYSRLKKNFGGHHFWARGYYVSTVGLDEAKVRKYIQDQDVNESVEDQYDTDLSNPFRGDSVIGTNHNHTHHKNFNNFKQPLVQNAKRTNIPLR